MFSTCFPRNREKRQTIILFRLKNTKITNIPLIAKVLSLDKYSSLIPFILTFKLKIINNIKIIRKTNIIAPLLYIISFLIIGIQSTINAKIKQTININNEIVGTEIRGLYVSVLIPKSKLKCCITKTWNKYTNKVYFDIFRIMFCQNGLISNEGNFKNKENNNIPSKHDGNIRLLYINVLGSLIYKAYFKPIYHETTITAANDNISLYVLIDFILLMFLYR